jgi:oxygen-independent coproporphyrinogen-3 oxidase
VNFGRYFAAELEALKPLADQGLVKVDAEGIEVTDTGWFFVRAVAMAFDRHLQANLHLNRFSKIL